MGANERDLVTSEGVDEGSQESVTETAGDQQSSAAGPRGIAAPDNSEQNAAPTPLGEQDPGPGQRQQVGEG